MIWYYGGVDDGAWEVQSTRKWGDGWPKDEDAEESRITSTKHSGCQGEEA